MKWFMPPTRTRGSQMQAAMHEPSTVMTIMSSAVT
jgi:hypothetical protein